MDLFDNAESVFVGDKEVSSIKIGENTLYEKQSSSPTPQLRTLHFNITTEDGTPATNVFVTMVDSMSRPIISNKSDIGECIVQGVSDGEWDIFVNISASSSSSMQASIKTFDGVSVNASHKLITVSGNATHNIVIGE